MEIVPMFITPASVVESITWKQQNTSNIYFRECVPKCNGTLLTSEIVKRNHLKHTASFRASLVVLIITFLYQWTKDITIPQATHFV
ncbi:hypothetical protein KUCAC02_014899 [Chaenocephalus aceratus]|uniref:Uncharacterized protein n=1 Tax=Chaenocephalus aceratus TaxID=36190 RepID=A0ACB9WFZ2_CHAAC|nr:hypothetical protein KUCAC02_014899 [Chaenocephalus aceratus]